MEITQQMRDALPLPSYSCAGIRCPRREQRAENLYFVVKHFYCWGCGKSLLGGGLISDQPNLFDVLDRAADKPNGIALPTKLCMQREGRDVAVLSI